MKIGNTAILLQPRVAFCHFSSIQQPKVVWKKWAIGAAVIGGTIYGGCKWIKSSQISSASQTSTSSFGNKHSTHLFLPAPLLVSRCEEAKRSVPLQSSLWVGRHKEIKQVEFALSDRSQTTPICLLNGLAGVGKTQLALRVMEKYNSKYPDCAKYIDIESSDKTETIEDYKQNLELLVIDNITSSEHLESALDTVRKVKPKRALLVGRYNPVNPSYFKTRMTHIELPGLSRQDLESLIQEIRQLPEREAFTSEGIEKIQDIHGGYNPGLFWSAAIPCSDMGFTNIGKFIDAFPKEAFSKHRPEYTSMEDQYQCIFKALSIEEEKVVCTIARMNKDKASFSLDELGLHGQEGASLATKLVERMILERFIQDGEPRYRRCDTGFLRFVQEMELQPKWDIPKSTKEIGRVMLMIAVLALSKRFLIGSMIP